LDVCCAASATAAARVRRPAAVEMVFRRKMEIRMPKLEPTGTRAHPYIVTR
jgi:hypothetical protein